MARVRAGWLTAALITSSAAGAAEHALLSRVDAALRSGSSFLSRAQKEDGSWRSAHYASFRDGYSLTPLAVKALWFGPPSPEAERSVAAGLDFLSGLVDEEGNVVPGEEGLPYPVYSAALSAVALGFSAGGRHQRARQTLVTFLRRRQLNEENGWAPSDQSYGGWGYYLGDGRGLAVPRKPPPGAPVPEMLSSNLTSTLAAASAIQMSGAAGDDPSLLAARVFVERSQNFAESKESADPRFDDGGFFFTPQNELQNKAGEAGLDRHGRRRYRSYGTMTADGLRALLRLGYPKEHPRVQAAAGWLRRRYSAKRCPGDYPRLREVQRGSVFFYWSWSSAHALRALEEPSLHSPRGDIAWPRLLAEELLSRQRPDGSWANSSTDMREDDPLVATPLALGALGTARMMLVAAPR